MGDPNSANHKLHSVEFAQLLEQLSFDWVGTRSLGNRVGYLEKAPTVVWELSFLFFPFFSFPPSVSSFSFSLSLSRVRQQGR